MRLIDADLLKKNIAKWVQGGDPQENVMVKLDDILVSVIMEIDEQPTAYDVEKVVKQLEDMKLIRVEQCHGDYEIEVMTINNFVDAIDIVKNGGK